MKTLRLFALSLVSVGLLAAATVAQEESVKPNVKLPDNFLNDEGSAPPPPVKKAPATTKTNKPASTTSNAAEPKLHTSPKLEAMLKEMGINFEKKVDEKAGVEYFVVRDFGAENFTFDIEESKSKNYLWVNFPCTKAPESGVPAEMMEKMLSENNQMATSFFSYYPKSRMIYLKTPLANNLDAKGLKASLNWIVKDASRTRNLWDSSKWNTAGGEDK